jgi:hypothetical protein
LNKSQLIAALKGTERPREMVVERQSSQDIIHEVCIAHVEHASDYDLISKKFEGGSVYDICQRLWKFCKEELRYKVESVEVQNVGCPYWILTHGVIDCKNFAAFIAGNLDSMKRRGLRVVWEFRFISDRPFSLFDREPDHVFVVVNPNTQDIWVDPVLDYFNEHIYYFYRRTKRINTMGMRGRRRVGAIGGIGGGSAIGSTAENSLLADVASYAQGLSGAMQQSISTSSLNIITESVLLGVATAVFPAAVVALAALKAGAVLLDKTFGVGAASSRILTDISNLDIAGMFSAIFNGRTYNTDQYWAAVYYQYYVLGNNVTSIDYVSDGDVLPALKWFIDRAGVFISGREHIIGLCTSPTAYENYYGVNSDTTTDMTLVNAASLMAQKNWPSPNTFNANQLGSWKNTVGVYDQALINLAASYGLTPEQLTAQTGTADAVAQAYTATVTPAATTTPSVVSFLTAQTIISGIPNALILAIGVGTIFVITQPIKK